MNSKKCLDQGFNIYDNFIIFYFEKPCFGAKKFLSNLYKTCYLQLKKKILTCELKHNFLNVNQNI